MAGEKIEANFAKILGPKMKVEFFAAYEERPPVARTKSAILRDWLVNLREWWEDRPRLGGGRYEEAGAGRRLTPFKPDYRPPD